MINIYFQTTSQLHDCKIIPLHEEDISESAVDFQIPFDFNGKKSEISWSYHQNRPTKVFFLGLGKRQETIDQTDLVRHFIFDHKEKLQGRVEVLIDHLEPTWSFEVARGITLALQHAPGLYKTDATSSAYGSVESFTVVHRDEACDELVDNGIKTGITEVHMMQWVDKPSNKKTPEMLGDYVSALGKELPITTNVFHKAELKEMNMHALLAVGQGSVHPPVLMQMVYDPPNRHAETPVLGLVGKGVTFDTGGISIKPSDRMHYMKSDMGGAAAVIGAVELAARLELPIKVVGIIPSAENSVDANSVNPGDVIQSHSGHTIEIIDTDAEGRLILADGLSYIQSEFSPDRVIDLATLTGSCVRALGYAAAGLFTKNRAMQDMLTAVGQEIHQKCWPLPLWDDYKADIESDIADVRNFSGKPIAGAITAAKFLEFFIADHSAWAHLDIAGVAFGDSPYTKMKSASGYGILLLTNYMRRLINNPNQ